MNNAVILVEDDSKYNYMIDTMFYDCKKNKNFLKIVEKKSNSRIVNFLERKKIQKYTKGKFNFLFSKKYDLYKTLKEVSLKFDNVYVLFLNSSFLRTLYPYNILKKNKSKWKNVKYILLYIDIIEHPVSRYANMLREKGIFDLIYTVDKEDSKKYNLELISTPYSTINKYESIVPENDIYFCGVTKDRGHKLKKILENIKKEKITTKMDIFCSQQDYKYLNSYNELANIYTHANYIPYTDVLMKTLKSKCILELIQETQSALTLRAYEAITYNRKLLTNCKTILDFKYYNPSYIQYFENIEDIDWEWVKRDIYVDYGYKGEYSSKKFVNDMIDKLEGGYNQK